MSDDDTVTIPASAERLIEAQIASALTDIVTPIGLPVRPFRTPGDWPDAVRSAVPFSGAIVRADYRTALYQGLSLWEIPVTIAITVGEEMDPAGSLAATAADAVINWTHSIALQCADLSPITPTGLAVDGVRPDGGVAQYDSGLGAWTHTITITVTVRPAPATTTQETSHG